MKHIGKTLKEHIEANHLIKNQVAEACGITSNYLSTIFTKESIDCKLLEKLCVATGLSAGVFFDDTNRASQVLTDIHQHTVVGSPTISVNDPATLSALLAEKERTIKILMAMNGIDTVTKTGQN